MDEKITLNDIKKEHEKRKWLERAKQGAEFVRENWVWMSVLGSAGIAITKKALSAHRINAEIRFKERTIYDHSLGRYVELKRPLTSRQALKIEERRADGEKLHMILNDMGLLKR